MVLQALHAHGQKSFLLVVRLIFLGHSFYQEHLLNNDTLLVNHTYLHQFFKASGTEAFLLTRHCHEKHNKNAYQIKFSLRKEKD